MQIYRFETEWVLEASIERVWEAITDVQTLPNWWPNVKRVEQLEAGDEIGLGSVYRYSWGTRLPYTLDFEMQTTEVIRPYMLSGHAQGELEGYGCWTLSEQNGRTRVVYVWEVRTTKSWMNLLAPLLRPAFEWNHDQVMKQGGKGLARHLGARLVSSQNRLRQPQAASSA